MTDTATITLGPDADALTFTVTRGDTRANRTSWHYVILHHGRYITSGNDLGTPASETAEGALRGLIGFAAAAADPHSGAGDLFDGPTTEALGTIADDLAIASYED